MAYLSLRKRAASLARESGDERPTEQSGSQKLDSEWNFATRVPLERRDEASRPLVPMIDHSSPYMPSHLSLDGTSPGLTVQQNASPGSSGPRFPTDELCSRALLNIIINDYLDLIYPLVPVVHRPSFRADLASDRDCKDPDFLCLVISLAALTVGLLPSRFPVYRAMAPEVAMRFETRTAMINCCSDICMRLRDHKYWDHISLRKWAVCYALSISFFQTGQTNRSRMLEVESTQVGRLLGLHRISDYNGLNCIETQLRKKAFWLLFYTFAWVSFFLLDSPLLLIAVIRHSALECGRRERLAFLDHYMLREVNFEALMPLPIDDEQILKHSIIGSTSPAASPSGSNSVPHRPPLSFNLSSAFIIHSQVFLQGVKEAISPDNCDCARRQTPEGRLSRLREHLQEIRYMLDDVPEPLRQWASTESYDSGDSPAPDLSGLRDRSSISLSGQDEANAKALLGQIGIMRADLHGTHLWLQSMLLDQIDVLIQKTAANEDAITAALKANWAEREDVCRQMLHLLHSMPYAHLEPNGLYLVRTLVMHHRNL